MTVPELSGGTFGEPPTARVTDGPPIRAVWEAKPPEGPWCPEEWLEHLRDLAPGLQPPEARLAPFEATGGSASSADWRLLCATARGRLHAHRGEHREDAVAALTFRDGWCGAVADGAGSAKWSRLGAAIATHVITHALREALQHGAAPVAALADAARGAATSASTAMVQFAERCGVPLRELRTTLLVAVVHGTRAATLQVGDGGVVLLLRDGASVLPHAGDAGEFSGEVTHFLPDDGALDRLLLSYAEHDVDNLRAILTMSDGIEDPWYPLGRHADTLFAQLRDGVNDANANVAGITHRMRGPVLAAPDPVHAAVDWLTFEKRGENDDRTLLLAWVPSAFA